MIQELYDLVIVGSGSDDGIVAVCIAGHAVSTVQPDASSKERA